MTRPIPTPPRDDIRRLQALLNKVGGLLDIDGIAGRQTRRAVREARVLAGLAPGEEATPALLGWLAARPAPSPDLPTEGVVFIAREEVGGRDGYERHAAQPHWPGGASGITIGVGYDLRFAAQTFEADWGRRLPPAGLAALRPHLGRVGSPADIAGLRGVHVPWRAAWQVFVHRSLPAHVARTRRAYPTLDGLPGLCRSVLVSLVYNRGAALAGARRQGMRATRDHLAAGRPEAVAAELLAMRRLWPSVPGLQARRAREAALWRAGLAQAAERDDAPAPL